jgi:hypothetical protein
MAFYTGLQECINSRKNTDCVVTARRMKARAQNFPVLDVFTAYVESCEEKNGRNGNKFQQCISLYLTK